MTMPKGFGARDQADLIAPVGPNFIITNVSTSLSANGNRNITVRFRDMDIKGSDTVVENFNEGISKKITIKTEKQTHTKTVVPGLVYGNAIAHACGETEFQPTFKELYICLKGYEGTVICVNQDVVLSSYVNKSGIKQSGYNFTKGRSGGLLNLKTSLKWTTEKKYEEWASKCLSAFVAIDDYEVEMLQSTADDETQRELESTPEGQSAPDPITNHVK